jgi:hypothetical protein
MEPMRAKVRRLSDDPNEMKSRREMDDPSRPIPKTLQDDPKRTNDLSESVLPRCTKSRTLKLEPSLVSP